MSLSEAKSNRWTGRKFGRLQIIQFSHVGGSGKLYYLTVCDCGKQKAIAIGDLSSGRTQSCGCLLRETTIKRFTKHGHSKFRNQTDTYYSWMNMKQRCTNKKHPEYANYGGRGIMVCDRWKKSFENFLFDMGEKPLDKTLNRINNNGNYEPLNCAWATQSEQSNNTRRNRKLEFQGNCLTVVQWAKLLGLPSGTIYARIKYGWSAAKALTTPIMVSHRKKSYG